MEIKRLHIENYKSIDNFDCEAFPKTIVLGKNGTGKTSLADAIVDIMCDKMTDGTSPNNIRPHDNSGNVRHYVPVIREITADIDGKCYTIRKTTEEKWRRPHGATENVYDGSKTTYSIDGYEKQLKDYNEWITEKIAKPEMISFYMNPQVFLNALRKSTTDARKLLEKVSGFNLQEFLSSNPQYEPIANIVGENPVEDVVKQLRRNLKNQKKELESAQSNLDYESNRKVETEIVDEELIKSLRENLISVNIEIESAESYNKDITEKSYQLNQDIMRLTHEKEEFEKEQNKEDDNNALILSARYNDLSNKRSEVMEKKMMLINSVSDAKLTINHINEQLEELKSKKLNFKCPTCGQELTPEMKEKIKSERDNKVATLKENLKRNEEFQKTYQKKLEEVSAEYESMSDEMLEIHEQLSRKSDPMPRPEWKHQDALDSIKSELESLKKVDVYDLQMTKSSIESQIRSETQKIEQNERLITRKEQLLSELSDAVKTRANACGEIERKIDMITEFSIKKNAALADKINPYFNHFYFSFLEYTELEGNPVETCKLIEKETKTDYMNGLNHGSRLVCETELVAGFQRMNGISLPIFLDDSESLDTNRIPNTEQQLFVLRRVDDKPLTVKEIRNDYIQ